MKHLQLHLLLVFVFLLSIPGSFGQLAKGKSKFLGCEWNYNQASGFVTLWNQSTPENAGKWGSVELSRDNMNWSNLDSTYNVAKHNNMLFKEHTLIWGSQQPGWMASLDSAAQRQEIEEWFSLLAARYPDIDYIDVVNEPIHTAPNGMTPSGSTTADINYAKALGGTGATGWDWVINSFKLARKYFPKSKLLINEYSVITSTSTLQKYISIIKLLQADSLIDGIGEQAHAGTTKGVPVATMKASLDSLAATGLPIYITEMDIDGSTDQIQLSEMQRVFTLFWEHPAVAGITFWGFRNGMWRSDEKAYLITPEGVERPALKWLKAYIDGTLTAMTSLSVSTSSGKTTISKGETLNMVATVLPKNTTFPDVIWTVVPSYLAKITSDGLLTATATKGAVTVTATAVDGSGVKGSLVITISDDQNPDNPSDTTDTDSENTMYLKSKTGTQTSVPLSNIRKIKFAKSNMIISKTNSDSIVFGLSSLRYLSFKNFTTTSNINPSIPQKKGDLTFYPNPVTDQLNLCFETSDVKNILIKIIDLQGRTLLQQGQGSVNGINNMSINVSPLSKGLYFCRVFTGEKAESFKFYKN